MQISAVTDQRVKKRTASFAMSVMVGVAAIPDDTIATAHEGEAAGLYACERLCSRSGGSPALGAMAIE
jgi:hypothetical protein